MESIKEKVKEFLAFEDVKEYHFQDIGIPDFIEELIIKFSTQWIELAEDRGKEIALLKLNNIAKPSNWENDALHRQLKAKDKQIKELKNKLGNATENLQRRTHQKSLLADELKAKDKEIEELKCYVNTVKMPIVERYEELEQELQRLKEERLKQYYCISNLMTRLATIMSSSNCTYMSKTAEEGYEKYYKYEIELDKQLLTTPKEG